MMTLQRLVNYKDLKYLIQKYIALQRLVYRNALKVNKKVNNTFLSKIQVQNVCRLVLLVLVSIHLSSKKAIFLQQRLIAIAILQLINKAKKSESSKILGDTSVVRPLELFFCNNLKFFSRYFGSVLLQDKFHQKSLYHQKLWEKSSFQNLLGLLYCNWWMFCF